MDFTELSKDWQELSDLRTKAAIELKAATIESLNALAEKLTKCEKFEDVFIGSVDFFEPDERTDYGNERTVLYWNRAKGYYFETECYQITGGGYEGWVKEECKNVKMFENLEAMNRENFKKIAKKLPKRVEELTKELQTEIMELSELTGALK